MRDAHERLGKKLANGCSKTAYEHLDDPTKVVLVVGKDYKMSMDKEMAVLEQLASYGIPVLKFHDVYTHNSKLYILCDRYKKGSKDGADVAALTTEKTVAAFDRIEAAALRHHIYDVADFQFLWAEDGSIAVAERSSGRGGAWSSNKRSSKKPRALRWVSRPSATAGALSRCPLDQSLGNQDQ